MVNIGLYQSTLASILEEKDLDENKNMPLNAKNVFNSKEGVAKTEGCLLQLGVHSI